MRGLTHDYTSKLPNMKKKKNEGRGMKAKQRVLYTKIFPFGNEKKKNMFEQKVFTRRGDKRGQ